LLSPAMRPSICDLKNEIAPCRKTLAALSVPKLCFKTRPGKRCSQQEGTLRPNAPTADRRHPSVTPGELVTRNAVLVLGWLGLSSHWQNLQEGRDGAWLCTKSAELLISLR